MIILLVLFIGDKQDPHPTSSIDALTCIECHDERASDAKELHFKLMSSQPKMWEASCESCHGPGSVHEDDPETDNILSKANLERIAANCKNCHPDLLPIPRFGTPAHLGSDLHCLDCHVSGHQAAPAEPLLAAQPQKLCGDCHGAVLARFNLPNAHRQGHAGMDCSDCHPSHKGLPVSQMGPFNQETCTQCHSAQAGPFIFSHPPHEVDGCLSCHEAHGSGNPFMLKRNKVEQICLECHGDTPVFHDLSQIRFRQCEDCHSAVHGSQRSPKLFEE